MTDGFEFTCPTMVSDRDNMDAEVTPSGELSAMGAFDVLAPVF